MVSLEMQRYTPTHIPPNYFCINPIGPAYLFYSQEMWQHGFRRDSATHPTQNHQTYVRINAYCYIHLFIFIICIFHRKCGSMVSLEIQRQTPTHNPPNYVCMNPAGPASKSSDQSSCGSVQEFTIHDDRALLLNQTNFVRFKPFQILSKLKSKSMFSLSLSRMKRL